MVCILLIVDCSPKNPLSSALTPPLLTSFKFYGQIMLRCNGLVLSSLQCTVLGLQSDIMYVKAWWDKKKLKSYVKSTIKTVDYN